MITRFIVAIVIMIVGLIAFKILYFLGIGSLILISIFAFICMLFGAEDKEIEEEVKEFKELIDITKDVVKEEFSKGSDSECIKRSKSFLSKVKFNIIKTLKILTKEESKNDKKE